jgi:hypothetical protein
MALKDINIMFTMNLTFFVLKGFAFLFLSWMLFGNLVGFEILAIVFFFFFFNVHI